jgi:DNA (cytosine-5)-methyltransferase 1
MTEQIKIARKSWPEAEVIADPLPRKKLKEPTILVRRRTHLLLGPREQEIVSLPGGPVISLFTGAGGFDLGIEQAGFCPVVQHEIDPACCETLIMNRPNCFRHAALIQGDIYATPTSLLLSAGNLRVGEAHLLIGGPPCQGFSTSNTNRKRAEADRAAGGKGDDRNDMVFQFLRVVREAQPKFFVMENVQGFISFNKGEYLKAVLETSYAAYYELVYGLVDACEYGVPQYRCRFFLMGTRRDLCDCDGILASLPAPETFSQKDLAVITGSDGTLFGDVRHSMMRVPGIRYFPDRPILVPPQPINDGGRSKTFLNFYDRLEREEPDRLVWSP